MKVIILHNLVFKASMYLVVCSQSSKVKSMRSRMRMHDDTLFWKKVAREYNAIEEAKVKESDMAAKQGDM